jgi:hypothetical protein
MAVQTLIQRNSLVDKYKADNTHVGLTNPAPTTTATELSGVARQASNWGTTSASAATASPAAHSVASGQTVAGMAFFDALTGGNYRDGTSVTSQTFNSAGTYTVVATYTQS